MLSEDVAITQALKAGIRVLVTSALILMYFFHKMGDGKKMSMYLSSPLPVWFYCGYLIFGTASLLWSSSAGSSLLQLVMDIETLVFAWFFMRMLSGYSQLYPNGYFDLSKILAPSVTLIAAGFAIGKFADPEQYYRYTHGGEVARLGGFIINPNELGMLLVVGIGAILPLLMKQLRYRMSVILLLSGLIYLLVLTGSRSSFMAMLAVFTVYALSHHSKVFKIFLAVMLALAVPLVGIGLFIKQGDISEVLSMTGRIPFWRDLLVYNFPKEPWFGFGYMRIDYADKFESLNAYAGAMTHNTFLQVLLGLGLTGFLIVIIQFVSFLQALISHPNGKIRLQSWLVFIPILVNSFTEFGIFGETNFGILFYLFLVFSVSCELTVSGSRIREPQPDETTSSIPYRSPSVA